MKHIQIILTGLLLLLLASCTEVLPRQRGYLALSHMALDPDPMESGLRQHTAFSKEAASGGYGGSGGGCGCN